MRRLEKLINRDIGILVGEPWDFTSELGENVLSGRIIEVSPRFNRYEWLLCDVSSFLINGVKINRVLAITRYIGDSYKSLHKNRDGINSHFIYYNSGKNIIPNVLLNDYKDDCKNDILKLVNWLIGIIQLK